jgi:hypothetical protein
MPIISDKNPSVPCTADPACLRWQDRFKKLGLFCFLFFLIKGLLWLLVPAALYFFSTQ